MPARDPKLRKAHARLAIHDRHHPDDTEGRARLAAEFDAARSDTWLQNVIDSAPPLTKQQAKRLSALLHDVPPDDAA